MTQRRQPATKSTPGQTQIFTVIDDPIAVKLDAIAEKCLQSRRNMTKLILEAAILRMSLEDVRMDLPEKIAQVMKDYTEELAKA